jgi:hypothetical protein
LKSGCNARHQNCNYLSIFTRIINCKTFCCILAIALMVKNLSELCDTTYKDLDTKLNKILFADVTGHQCTQNANNLYISVSQFSSVNILLIGLNSFGIHCYIPGVLLFQSWIHNTEVNYIYG